MSLSDADRARLRDRAAGLVSTLSSLSAAQVQAATAATQDYHDAKLIAEVDRLERETAAAAVALDPSKGTVEDALEAMRAAAAKEEAARAAATERPSGEPVLDEPAPEVQVHDADESADDTGEEG